MFPLTDLEFLLWLPCSCSATKYLVWVVGRQCVFLVHRSPNFEQSHHEIWWKALHHHSGILGFELDTMTGWDFGLASSGRKHIVCSMCWEITREKSEITIWWSKGWSAADSYVFKKFHFLFPPSHIVRLHFLAPFWLGWGHVTKFWLMKCEQNWSLTLSGLAHENFLQNSPCTLFPFVGQTENTWEQE